MKFRSRLAAACVAAAAVLTGATAALGADPADQNLIPNPGVVSDSAGWTAYAGSGGPAELTRLDAGFADPGSLRVTFTELSGGGPAWYSPEVAVGAGARYFVSVNYQSTATSELLAQIFLADKSVIYRRIARLDPSAKVVAAKAVFTAPDNATSVRIYQEITSSGSLVTDNYAMTPATSADVSSGVPNGKLEQVDDIDQTKPLGWNANNRFGLKASLTYVKNGRTGRAVRAQMNSAPSGGRYAYWEYTPQSVTPGRYYEFSDWYRSSVPTRVLLEIERADGTYSEISQPTVAESPSKWVQYKTRFYVPANAVAAHLIHVPLKAGWVMTDDYALNPSRPGALKRPLVSLSFDDGTQGQLDSALPALEKNSLKGTFFLVPGFFGTDGYVASSAVARYTKAGQEVGAHTMTHPDLTAISATKRRSEITQSKKQLVGLGGGAVSGFASPFGEYNATTLKDISSAGFGYQRGLDEGLNETDGWDKMRIKSYLVMRDTTSEELKNLLAEAAADNTWLVLVWHGVEENGDAYAVTPAQFEAQMAQIVDSKITVLTMAAASAEVDKQVVAYEKATGTETATKKVAATPAASPAPSPAG